MNDQLNDVLAAIDAETAKCICGRPVPKNGPSLDYCSLPCQERFISGLDPITEPVHDVWKGTSDGRTINAEVNAWFRASSNDHPDMGWASAAATLHEEPGRDAPPVSPRVEFFPSPRPGEPIELAAGIDLTPYLVGSVAQGSNRTTIPAPQAGPLTLRVVQDVRRPGHDMHTSDDGQRCTLTCSCDEFTAVLDGGTEESRQAEAFAAHNQHINRTRR